MPMPNRERTGDQSWLYGAARTWRWNEGTYEGRGCYEAVEVTPNGLCWYQWNHSHGDGGPAARTLQNFAAFETDGPLRALPDRIAMELRAFLVLHGYNERNGTARDV